MSGITTGVGLFSGIDSRQLIDQLISLEARPKQLAQQRLLQLQSQQASFLDINSALLGLKTAAAAFNSTRVFQASKATSSNPSVLTATAGTSATPGAYQISVGRLVTADQQISKGFANKNISGLGLDEISFEIGGGQLATETLLTELNGGQGIQRGKIKITDSGGDTATVDLSRAVTVNDVLEAINNAAGISVAASITTNGDRIQITDAAAGSGNLRIDNVAGSETATSLGILNTAGVAAGGTITSSSSLLFLSESTQLSSLRDGAGVNFGAGGQAAATDFRIKLTDAGDATNTRVFNIVLGEIGAGSGDEYEATSPPVTTVGELIARINEQTEGEVVASVSADGRSLVLTDTTGDTARTLTVEDTARGTASDLGLLTGTTSGAQGAQALSSRRLVAGINSTLASSLNGGLGVSAGTFNVTRRDGTNFDVAIAADSSVADVINAINSAGGGTVTARINDAGNGITVNDSTTGGSLIIADSSGTAAADLGIDTAGATSGVVRSGNLQSRWISNATQLANLNGGRGVGTGEFKITDSQGRSASIRVTSAEKTVFDLVKLINDRTTQLGINARINDQGDGIVIEDDAGGTIKMKIEDASGSVAKRLNLAGESAGSTPGSNRIDGSFERVVDLDAGDTLEEVVNKINAKGVGVDATIVNAGGGANPFRIVVSSETSGRVGRISVDTGGVDLGFSTLTKGQDAVAFFGSTDPAQAVLLTSSTNTLRDVVAGVEINLQATSAEAVELTVTRDTAKVEETIGKFVEAFNKVLERLAFHERFDVDTGERGSLLGDAAPSAIRNQLISLIQGEPQGVESDFTRLFQTGLRVGEGSNLEFDSERFREALESDPQGVADLFAAFDASSSNQRVIQTDSQGNPTITTPERSRTYTRLGVMERIKLYTTDSTSTIDGSISRRKQNLDSAIELQNARIGEFDIALNNKRARLERQFVALEQALAALQSQQAALSSITASLG